MNHSVMQEVLQEVGVSNRDRRDFEKACVMYVMRVIPFSKFSKRTRRMVRTELNGSAIKDLLFKNFNIMVRVRAYLCAMVKNFGNEASVFDAIRIARQFGLKHWDVHLYYLLVEEKLSSLKEQLEGRRVLKPTTIRRKCDEMVQDEWFERRINSFVHRKLRFIASSNNLDIEDLKKDLATKAIEAFWADSLWYDGRHLFNRCLKAATNYGNNLISYYTAQCRSRLSSDGEGGYQNTQRELMVGTGDSTEAVGERSHTVDYDTMISIRQFRDQLGNRDRNLMDLLMLNEDKRFVRWCKEMHRMKVATVSDVLTKCREPARYIDLVCQFMRVAKAVARRFLRDLQTFCMIPKQLTA